jgi:hypothetical protein
MDDGTAVFNKSLVRLYAWHYSVFAKGWPLGDSLNWAPTEIRFVDGRASHRQPMDNSLVGDGSGFADWTIDAETAVGCWTVVWDRLQRVDENHDSRTCDDSCGSWNAGIFVSVTLRSTFRTKVVEIVWRRRGRSIRRISSGAGTISRIFRV